MPKFMGIHTLPPGGFTAEQVRQLAQAAQQDPVVKGYRSFCSLAEGKAVCILEAPEYVFMGWDPLFSRVSVKSDSRKTSGLRLSDTRNLLVFSHPGL